MIFLYQRGVSELMSSIYRTQTSLSILSPGYGWQVSFKSSLLPTRVADQHATCHCFPIKSLKNDAGVQLSAPDVNEDDLSRRILRSYETWWIATGTTFCLRAKMQRTHEIWYWWFSILVARKDSHVRITNLWWDPPLFGFTITRPISYSSAALSTLTRWFSCLMPILSFNCS